MAKYSVKEFEFKDIQKGIKEGKIQYPKFQRNIVWGKDKVVNLITTIQKGFPFGSILLYKESNFGTDNYKLIDGLQRYTAISKYQASPMQYYPTFDEEFEDLVNLINSHVKSKLIISDEVLQEVAKELRSNFLNTQDFSDMEVTNIALPYLSALQNDGRTFVEITSFVTSFIKSIEEKIQVGTLKIPVIVFEGEESELTEVFQRINEGGKPLSKYEIFASSWCDYEIEDFKDEEITKILEARYSALSEKVGDLDFDFEYINLNTINVFEYCFALSKIVSNQIDGSKTDDQIDTLGFNLIASILGIQIKDLAKIGSTLLGWKAEELYKLKEAIKFSTINTMERIESKFKYSNVHKLSLKDYQLISYIATVFKMNYTIEGSSITRESQYGKKDLERVYKSIEADILLNIFENRWGNSGNTQLDKALGLGSDSLKYLKLPTNKELIKSFETYLERQNENEAMAGGVKTNDKMILSYFLNNEIRENGEIVENLTTVDVEHIITKDILKKNDIKLVSPLCNVCYLPKYENRSKKNEFMYDFYNSGKLADVEEEVLQRFNYPTRDELQSVNQVKHDLSLDVYKGFLEKRKEVLVEKFANIIL